MPLLVTSAAVVIATVFLVVASTYRRRLSACQRELDRLAARERELDRLAACERDLERRTQELEVSRAAERQLLEELKEARRGEDDARRAMTRAEAANHAKSMFLANMSHELRTPLNSMLGFAQLMERDRSISAQHRENLAVISKSGEHLLGLLNDILEMAKIEAGRITLSTSDFDLHEMLKGLADMFAVQAMKKGLALTVERDPSVPRWVQADEGKLRQVLINLLANALKFTSKGEVRLRAWARMASGAGADESPTRVRLSFEVSDTGRGLATHEIAKLFEAFSQTEAGKQAKEGAGLGLHISREFVRLMGGEIRVESELGQGATFLFDIRATASTSRDGGGDRLARKVVGIAPGQPKYRILVVDDRWETRHLLFRLLDSVGFDVRSATNGLGAMAQWETWAPHLILMDMRMPLLDGYEATKTIKASPQGASTVVVAMTASAFEHNRALVMAAGCDDFLSKPFRDAELFGLLAKHLDVRLVHDAPERADAEATQVVDLARGLAGLPDALREELTQASMRLDPKAVRAVIDQVRPRDAQLADAMMELVQAYRFDRLLALTAKDDAESSGERRAPSHAEQEPS